MFPNNRTTSTRLFSLLLALIIIISTPTSVLAENLAPRASDYLDSYNTYLYRESFGRIQVWFTVTGVDDMDEIGVLTVRIYESTDNETWTRVHTYKHNTTVGMLGHNKFYHSGHVEYNGTVGRYYKAYVTIWAGKDGNGDTRYMWTDIQKATLFAG